MATVGYLVKLGFDTTLKLSSIGDINYNGEYYQHADVAVSDIKYSRVGSMSLSLLLGDRNKIFTAIVLNQGINSREIFVYAIFIDNQGNRYIEPMFRGVGDGFDLTELGKVKINAVTFSAKTMFSPRLRVEKEGGFNHLPVRGTILTWGDTTIILE